MPVKAPDVAGRKLLIYISDLCCRHKFFYSEIMWSEGHTDQVKPRRCLGHWKSGRRQNLQVLQREALQPVRGRCLTDTQRVRSTRAPDVHLTSTWRAHDVHTLRNMLPWRVPRLKTVSDCNRQQNVDSNYIFIVSVLMNTKPTCFRVADDSTWRDESRVPVSDPVHGHVGHLSEPQRQSVKHISSKPYKRLSVQLLLRTEANTGKGPGCWDAEALERSSGANRRQNIAAVHKNSLTVVSLIRNRYKRPAAARLDT